jgi:mycothiol synthase
MTLHAGYELRAPTPGDLAAVADVFVAVDTGEAGVVVLDADLLRDEWSRAGFELASDAWVAIDRDGAVVGYMQTMLEEPNVECWGAVHPGHRGRGIGSALLDRAERRTSELMTGLPSPRFRFVIDGGDHGAEELVQSRGLRLAHHFWHMQIDLTGPVEPGAAPDGVEISEVHPASDLPAVHAVLAEAFVDHWDYNSEPFDRWVEEHVDVARFDPTLWLLAHAAGEPVAALTGRVQGDRGWVGSLGCGRPGGVAASARLCCAVRSRPSRGAGCAASCSASTPRTRRGPRRSTSERACVSCSAGTCGSVRAAARRSAARARGASEAGAIRQLGSD